MEVEHNGIGLFAERTGGENLLADGEGVMQIRMHEDAAHDVGHKHARAVLGEKHTGALAGRAEREIRRAQEPLFA